MQSYLCGKKLRLESGRSIFKIRFTSFAPPPPDVLLVVQTEANTFEKEQKTPCGDDVLPMLTAL